MSERTPIQRNPAPPSDETVAIPDVLPVVALRDTVVFPYIIVPLSVSRDESAAAVDRALSGDRVLMLVSQRPGPVEGEGDDDAPAGDGPEAVAERLHRVGTAATVMRMLKLPDGRMRILVQGLARTKIEHLSRTDPYLEARVARLDGRGDRPASGPEDGEGDGPDSGPEPRTEPRTEPGPGGDLGVEALMRSVQEGLERAANLGRTVSPEVMVIAANLDDPGRLADLAASNLELEAGEAQEILEILDPLTRLQRVGDLLAREIKVLTMQNEISSQARDEMDRSQREYFLRQQLKAIQDELGEGDELAEEIAGYRTLADEREMPDEAREEMERQIRRLERSHPESAETSILRTYLDWLTAMPWALESEDDLDIQNAARVLDEDHYDLEKVKERILEYLAVRKLKPDARGPLLCFVGPPGVGKTSLGRSIARALGRKFVRLSLGGVRDEAEIRGHRRTYVGALPGRILQGLRQAGTSNPVFMLDEIDKLGADYRGDPSSALLEVLDPEQNSAFSDHYLGVPYDLSRVMFIATANLLDPVQPAFVDRMEVLRLTGYTEAEKLVIAERHLIPKQLEANGVGAGHLAFSRDGVKRVIGDYTREAGLRNLERELAAICRKVAVRVARDADDPGLPLEVGPEEVAELLGPARHHSEELLDRDRVGVATGLAWTAAGGDLMLIEVAAVPGKGKLSLTGQLGEVMKESAQAALSFARAWTTASERRGDDPPYGRDREAARRFFAEHDLHVHVPAGSIPKDGPSAGITIATAILSVLLGVPVDRRVALTGEITLRGTVLPIGGLKEKLMAARIAGVASVLVPAHNRRDLAEVPEAVREGLDIRFVETMDDVLAAALAVSTKGGCSNPPPRTSESCGGPSPESAALRPPHTRP